ncbi:hypothetical protein [Actinophytocola oryzae]|nr:hypothetical protein [Actinophytocola oryzae]
MDNALAPRLPWVWKYRKNIMSDTAAAIRSTVVASYPRSTNGHNA